MGAAKELRPAVEFATGQSSVKGEDFVLVQPQVCPPKPVEPPYYSIHTLHLSDSASSQHNLSDAAELSDSRRSLSSSRRGRSLEKLDGQGSFGLFCVMDGHNGKAAAQHLHATLLSTLEERLPSGAVPPESNHPAYVSWCDDIQHAVIATLTSINEDFACRGELAGTTVTILLQYNWLLTVANLGDSKALLDVGNSHLDLSEDHRISTHQGDRRRLEAMGAHIAPICSSGRGPASKDGIGYGPLRVWPGGSCLSRGIGDFDIGPPVIACPYISQVKIPETGGRVIVASDGVWDGFENIKKLLKISRLYNCQTAPDKIIHCLKNAYGGLIDDTSLIVLDVMPPGASFQELAARQNKKLNISRSLKSQRSSSSGCLCFSGSSDMVKEDTEDVSVPKAIQPPEVVCQIDVAEAVGLMTQKTSTCDVYPSWCTSDFCETIRTSQEAACKAWNEARSIRSTGRTPSRMDLESFFSAVHHIKPLEDPNARPATDVSVRPRSMEEQRHLDITTRPPPMNAEETLHHHRENENGTKMRDSSERQSWDLSREGSQNASVHFRDHVGQPSSYPRKFGLYNSHMYEGGGDSSTEDDSHRNGSYHSSYVSSPQGTPSKGLLEADLQEDEIGENPIRRRRSHGSFELSGHGSATALPTVVEETPSKSQKLEDIVNECHNFSPETTSEEATELAVRRGKNRFITAGSGISEQGSGSPSSAKSLVGKPPLPALKAA